jgi:cytochrome c oxidase accessory protein FixG
MENAREKQAKNRVLHPMEARGKWATRRTWIQGLLVAFFLAVPWITIGGKPLLLLDVLERRFTVFGILFRAHDTPLIFLLIIGFLLSFALLTALFGRVWCGWACPQTVFIELVFRRIERWTEGSASVRRKNETLPMTSSLFFRRSLKWFLWTCVAATISHSFVAVFTGPERLGEMIAAGPSESPLAFGIAAFMTLLFLFDFGWFKEQFCVVVCPYGRIQSLFQDRQTRTVLYDVNRGEPRGAKRAANAMPTGDCVDCFRCVGVCPTGIDIRNGSSQLECIACTACMDACDDVMARLKRPLGLIRYASIDETSTTPAPTDSTSGSNPAPSSGRVSPRAIAYGAGVAIAMSALIFFLADRKTALIEVFKTRGAPFITLESSEGEERFANLFMSEVSNQSDRAIEIEFKPLEGNGIELIMPNNPVRLESGAFLKNPFTIRFPRSALSNGKAQGALNAFVRDAENGETLQETRKELSIVGPF